MCKAGKANGAKPRDKLTASVRRRLQESIATLAFEAGSE